MFDCIWVQVRRLFLFLVLESVASPIVQMRNESKLQKCYYSPYIAHGDKNVNQYWPAVIQISCMQRRWATLSQRSFVNMSSICRQIVGEHSFCRLTRKLLHFTDVNDRFAYLPTEMPDLVLCRQKVCLGV